MRSLKIGSVELRDQSSRMAEPKCFLLRSISHLELNPHHIHQNHRTRQINNWFEQFSGGTGRAYYSPKLF